MTPILRTVLIVLIVLCFVLSLPTWSFSPEFGPYRHSFLDVLLSISCVYLLSR